MDEQNLDILDRIHGAYYQLTTTEKRVADCVLSQPVQVQYMSITQLADECGTAEATISRFCRSLKLKSFNAFKLELARHCAAAPRDSYSPSPVRLGQDVERQVNEAVRQTIELMDPEQVDRTVALIEKAPRVLCVGSGGSMLLAQECAHLFSNVTGKFLAVSDSHMQMSAAATLSDSDLIILYSYSGATTTGIQILEYARSRGISTILVTRYNKSPAAKLADVVLCCGSNEGPFQFGSTPAKIAQLVVTDVIFQEYRQRNQAACEENIQQVAAALAALHV